jgi:peptide/nickel transport system substrate-binding protein/oligopeptide transport system substrate-binding protein
LRGSGSRALLGPVPLVRLLLSLLVLLGACTTGPSDPRDPPPESVSIPTALRVGIAEPLSIDPAHADSSGGLLVIEQVFDGLVARDPDAQTIVPAASTRWDVLGDGSVIEFHLRKAAFHDGAPLRARDFVFAWNRLADPVNHSPFAFLLEAVAGYREFHVLREGSGMSGLSAPDDATLRVQLTRPWPGFVALTAHPALSPVPPSASSLDFDAEPVGNGPYRISTPWGIGQPIELERFEGYSGPAPSIDRLIFSVYEQAEEGWPDFLAGDLDIASVPPSLVPTARTRYGDAGIVVLARLLYCGFNLKLKPFQDVRLRRAVSMSLDRTAIAAAVYGEVAVAASGIVPPTVPGFDPTVCGAHCAQDAEEAARLVSELPAERRAFELQLIESEVGEQLSETLSAQLEAVGFDVTPRLLDEEAYGEVLQQDRQRAFCLVWDADTATQQGMLEPLLFGESPDNHSNVRTPRLDVPLSVGRKTFEEGGRRASYLEAERQALEMLPIVPLVWFRSHLAVQPYVRGFRLDALGMFEVSALELLPEGPEPGPSATP